MTALDVEPGHALGRVVIGSSEADLLSAVGPPNSRREASRSERTTLYWDAPRLRVDLDVSGVVEFVELTWDPTTPAAMYDGIDLLGTQADVVAQALISSDGGSFNEQGHGFACPTGLALWRPILPGSDDTQYDEYRDGAYWATVAVAARGYW